jgi:3-deoxy-D-manno-octulosonic-acid transferase
LDVAIPLLAPGERSDLRRELGLGEADPVLLGSSTWPGEEQALLEVWRRLRDEGLSCRLLLVPRHAERRDEVKSLLDQAGVSHHFRSQGPATDEVDVAVGDTTGELRAFTQLAEVVFVGKSLPPHHEGQTPVEAAALGKAIVFGPHLSNFRSIAEELLSAGAARSVNGVAELGEVVEKLLRTPSEREAMGGAAQTWQRRNRGAVKRTVSLIHSEISGSAN